MPNERDVIPDTVRERVCSDPAVEFALAFGSYVDGNPTEGSDFDLAIKFADRLSAGERFRKRYQLAGHAQDPDAPFVDISDVEELPLKVAYKAVTGEFMCGDDSRFRDYRERIERRYQEESDRIDRRQREVIDRIAEEGLHG